jgi:lincosamide nucleotidyltransferase A/C/D/E
MNAQTVLTVLAALEAAGIEIWLDGGWGVDALLGKQTREHRDLDLIVAVGEVPRLEAVLDGCGFHVRSGGTTTNFVMAHDTHGEADVHAIEFDERGYGVFALPDGRRWPFPPSAFAGSGCIGSRRVRCLSPEAQVQCHAQGYVPTESDLADMERLQERFGVVLPLILCRQPRRQ